MLKQRKECTTKIRTHYLCSPYQKTLFGIMTTYIQNKALEKFMKMFEKIMITYKINISVNCNLQQYAHVKEFE